MNLNSKVKAVIFDMDGVLIDSEIVYLMDLYEKLSINRPWLQIEDLYPIVGSDNERTKRILCDVAHESVDSIEFNLELDTIFKSCEVYYPKILRPEVPVLLSTLHELGYKIALASSTKSAGIEKVLTQCKIKEAFDYVISGEFFRESKPNPEIYLHVAERLELGPVKCLVVEDSTYGISAGVDAGMRVVAIKDERFGFDQSRANYMIENLFDLLGILEKLEKNED